MYVGSMLWFRYWIFLKDWERAFKLGMYVLFYKLNRWLCLVQPINLVFQQIYVLFLVENRDYLRMWWSFTCNKFSPHYQFRKSNKINIRSATFKQISSRILHKSQCNTLQLNIKFRQNLFLDFSSIAKKFIKSKTLSLRLPRSKYPHCCLRSDIYCQKRTYEIWFRYCINSYNIR